MKRNLDLIRDILLKREESREHRIFDTDFQNKYDILDINYNIELLEDLNFIECTSFHSMIRDEQGKRHPYKAHTILRITAFGHDYLDSIRNDSIYKETKEKIGPLISSATLDIIKTVATSLIMSKIGI